LGGVVVVSLDLKYEVQGSNLGGGAHPRGVATSMAYRHGGLPRGSYIYFLTKNAPLKKVQNFTKINKKN